MDTEPPVGDELQRMLVTMKQGVLERATPRSKRRHGHTGVVVGVVALLALGTASGAVALTLSQQDRPVAAPVQTQEPAPAPSATTPTSAPITPTPTPVATPARAATIPASCVETVPASERDRLFGGTPSVEQGRVGDISMQPDALGNSWVDGWPTLRCAWMDPRADVTSLEIRIGTPAPGAEQRLASAAMPCQDRDGGRMCQQTTRLPDYPVDRTDTFFLRDDTYIVITQVNFPTDGLLDAVVGEIWGD